MSASAAILALRNTLRQAAESPFVRDLAKLVSGTIGGRIILLAALPLATRLYSPEDFSLLAVYLAVVGTVAVVACMRFDIAIPLAANTEDAVHLLVLALAAAAGVSGVLAVVVITMPDRVAGFLGKPALAPHLWLVPLGTFMMAAYSALQFWATRAHRFGTISITRLTQAGIGVATILGMGWAGAAPLGLLLGNALAMGSGGVRLGISAVRSDSTTLRGVSLAGLRERLRSHRNYPLFSAPEALANAAGIQLPIILIAAQTTEEAGFLYLAMSVMAAPMALLGQSIAQVYASRAAGELQRGQLETFTRNIMRKLALIGAPLLILAGTIAPLLFPVIFGADWIRAGIIVAWIAPWMTMQFIASPVSLALAVTGNQAIGMKLQLLGLAIRVGSVLAVNVWMPGNMVEAYALSGFLFYSIYVVVVLRVVSRR